MKKLIVVLVAALMAFTANAQYYVGGHVGFTSDDDYSSFTIRPDFGYVLNDQISVGAVIGYYSTKMSNMTSSEITINPYLRYNLAKIGIVNVFVDGEVAISIPGGDAEGDTTFGLGVCPGISIPVTDKLSFVTHLGQFGYYNESIILDADMRALAIGVFYNF